MSTPWKVLGIDSEADRDAIRRAYAKKLKVTNPEDDPDGFKRLREAYERALQHCAMRKANAIAFDGPANDEVSTAEVTDRPTDVGDENSWDDEAVTDPPREPTLDERERQDLWARLAGLAGYFEEGPRDDKQAVALFDAIVAHPAMANVDARKDVEYAIGSMIAQNVPRSDGILLRAMRAFDWERLGVGDQWPFSAVRARHEEWRLIQAMEGSGHRLHTAWMLLTRPPNRLRRRMTIYLPVARRMDELIDIIDYQAEGLQYSVIASELDWWRAQRATRRIDVSAVGAAAVQASALALPFLFLDAPAWAAGIVIVATIVASLVTLLFEQDGDPWGRGNPRISPALARAAVWWPLVLAALPVVSLLAPEGVIGVALTLLVGTGTLLLMTVAARTPRPAFSQYWGVLLVNALAIGAAGSGLVGLDPVRLAAFVPLALLMAAPLVRVQEQLLLFLDQHLRRWGFAAVLAYAAVLIGIALFATSVLGIAPSAALLMVLLGSWGLLWQLYGSQFLVVRLGGLAARGAAILALFTLFGMNSPVNTGPSASNGDRIVAATLDPTAPSLNEERAALIAMQRGNPALRSRIAGLQAAAKADPSQARAIAGDIDAALDEEFARALPRSTNALLSRWAVLKAQLLTDLRRNKVAMCDDRVLPIGEVKDEKLRRRASQLMLAIVASAPSTEPTDISMVADGTAIDAATDKYLQDLRATSFGIDQTNEDLGKCLPVLARAMAYADLPPDILGPTLRLGKVRVSRQSSAVR